VSEGTMTRFKVQKAEPLHLEYLDVIDAIQTDRLPMISGEDGVAVLKVVSLLAGLKNTSVAVAHTNEDDRQRANVEVEV
jgi:UDP-N-acetylglucosamine 3-dehydrogenase